MENGLRKLSTFITADALLTAILLVWAQLWIQPSLQLWSKNYEPGVEIGRWFDSFNSSAGFGLMWTYSAVFLALLAIVWAGWKTLAICESKTPDTAIGLFSASLIMGLANVAQSISSLAIKIFKHWYVFKPLDFEWANWFLLLIIPIVGLSIWGAHWLKKGGKLKYLPWCLEIIVIGGGAGLGLFFV